MTDLADELNVSPRCRITVPENCLALVLPRTSVDDIRSMLILIRKGKRIDPATRNYMKEISGELLLAILEAENG